MPEPGLIAAYLAELRYSVGALPDAEEIVAETEDHLLAAVDAALARGVARADAEAQAVAGFGSAPLVARVFAEEARRGGAVSSRVTRRAGLAGMVVPLLLGLGETGNRLIPRGPLHGVALALLAAGFGALSFALWGLRQRHGGLGPWGRAAFWLFLASPFLAAPFGWGAGYAFLCVQLVVVTVLGVGMIRARVLPPGGVALFTFTPAATVAAAAVISAVGLDTGPHLVPAGVAISAVGLARLGWAMWQEPALDVAPRAGTGPLAAA